MKTIYRTILGAAMLAHSLCAATYFVDANGGDDSNAGTSAGAAWQTIAKVSAHTSPCFNADDVIMFKRGEVWNETLAVPCSGTSGRRLTFTTYGASSTPPIFELTSVIPLASCVTSTDKDYFTIDGILCRFPTGPHIAIANSTGVVIMNNTLLHSAGNHGIQFSGTNKDARVLRNTIQDDSGRPTGGTGIICLAGGSCDGILIEKNTVTRFGDVRKAGIILYDSDAAIIRWNIVTLNDIGIQLHTAHKTIASAQIYGNQILDTKLYSGGDGEGMELTGCAPATASVCPSPDAGNTFLVTASVFNNFWANPNTSNANDALGGVVQDSIDVYNNIVQGPATYGFHVSSVCNGGKFYGNSFYNISNTGILLDVGCLNNKLKNNIVHTAAGHCIFAHATATGSFEDYNVCYSSGSKSGFTGGSHDQTTDPKFATTPPTTPAHFKLQSSSPAIGAGDTLGPPYAATAFSSQSGGFPFDTTDQGTAGGWEIGAFAQVTGAALGALVH